MSLLSLSLSIGGGYSALTPPLDETPDAFTFTDVTGAATFTQYESDTIVVSGLGLDVSVVVTVTGGEYSKNGGAYTSAAGTALNGDTFKVRQTSSAVADQTTNCVLTIGGVSDTYSVSTSAVSAPFSAVAADGWQATVDSPSDLSLLPATVSRAGFDATGSTTTHTDTLYLTKRVRQPYPNQASLTTNSQALSDYVYSTDTISGATNNSAETSPKPVANWVMPHRLVVGNSVDLEVVAFHRNARAGKQVACVVFRATDGTTTVTQTVAAAAVSGRTGDRNAVLTYKASLDITSLNAGLITCHAKVYPWIGGSAAVIDSADQSAGREFSARYFLKNTGSKTYYYVKTAANGGNDGTGAGSTNPATASGTPFATVLAALNKAHTDLGATTGVDMAEIRIGDDGGTPFVMGSASTTRTQKIAALTITRDPTVARANARVSWGAASFRPMLGGALVSPITTGALRFTDIKLVRTGTASLLGEAATQLEIIFDDVDLDNASNNAAWLSNSHDNIYGMTATNIAGNTPLAAVTGEHRIIRGLSADMNNNPAEGWLVVGSAIERCSQLQRGTRSFSGSIRAFNKFLKFTGSSAVATWGSDSDVTGAALVQNVIEYYGSGSPTLCTISADSATGTTSHSIVHNNTFAGSFNAGRSNLFYDEGATARTNKLMSCKGNIHVQINTKGDVFRGVNQAGGDASTRLGNWAYLHGVGCEGELSQFIDANNGGIGTSFAQAYPGRSASIGTSTTVRNDPLFTSFAATTYNGSTYSAGAGGGDYSVQSGSPCKTLLLNGVLAFDLAGSARSAANDTTGAYA